MTLKILHKRSVAVTGGVSDAPLPTDLEYGEIGINYADADPALFIKDSADVVRRLDLNASEENKKYSVANDDAGLVGADATAAINAALIANGDIADASELGVSDQCEVTDSGNPDANPEVTVGRYWYDGAVWFIGGGGGGGASVTVSDTAPIGAAQGDLWWDSSSDGGRLWIWYEDADSSQWVEASPPGSGGGGDVEEAPIDGQQYARQNAAWSVVQAGGSGDTVIYNGASAWGKVAADGTLLNGLNIASVTKEGNKECTVVFTTPMPSDTYAVNVSTADTDTNRTAYVKSQTTTGFVYGVKNASATISDTAVGFAVHSQNALPPSGTTGTDAWGHFDGSSGISDSSRIKAAYNFSSVTRTAKGEYAVTFTTPMPTANYAVTATGNIFSTLVVGSDRTVNGFTIRTKASTGTETDATGVSFSVNATNANLPYTFTKEQIEAAINNTGSYAWASTADDGTLKGSNGLTCTKTGTGEYTYTFNTPLPDANYAITCSVTDPAGWFAVPDNQTVSSFTLVMRSKTDGASPSDKSHSVVVTAAKGQPLQLGGGADAWAKVTDDGTLEQGHNIASVTKSGTGDYDIVFTTPMPTANYAAVGTVISTSAGQSRTLNITSQTVTGFKVRTKTGSNFVDFPFSFSVHATDGNAGGFWGRTNDGILSPANSGDDVSLTGTGSIKLPAGTEAERPGTPAAGMLRFNEDAYEFEGYDGIQWGAIGGGSGGDSVTYNGASAWGDVAADGTLQNGLNIASVTRTGTGTYDVVFATPMPTANYAISGLADKPGFQYDSKTVNGFSVITKQITNVNTNPSDADFSFAVHSQNALPPAGTTGTDAWGTVQDDGTLDAGYNIASVTRTGTGAYDVVFATPMPTANYSVQSTLADLNTVSTTKIGNRTVNGFTAQTGYQPNGSTTWTPFDHNFSFSVNATNANLPYTFTKEQIEVAVNNTGAYAWAKTDGDGLLNGGNGLTCTRTSAGVYQYTFNTPLPDTNYAVNATVNASGAYFCGVKSITTTGFVVQTYVQTDGGPSADKSHAVVVTAARANPSASVVVRMLGQVFYRTVSYSRVITLQV